MRDTFRSESGSSNGDLFPGLSDEDINSPELSVKGKGEIRFKLQSGVKLFRPSPESKIRRWKEILRQKEEYKKASREGGDIDVSGWEDVLKVFENFPKTYHFYAISNKDILVYISNLPSDGTKGKRKEGEEKREKRENIHKWIVPSKHESLFINVFLNTYNRPPIKAEDYEVVNDDTGLGEKVVETTDDKVYVYEPELTSARIIQFQSREPTDEEMAGQTWLLFE